MCTGKLTQQDLSVVIHTCRLGMHDLNCWSCESFIDLLHACTNVRLQHVDTFMYLFLNLLSKLIARTKTCLPTTSSYIHIRHTFYDYGIQTKVSP